MTAPSQQCCHTVIFVVPVAVGHPHGLFVLLLWHPLVVIMVVVVLCRCYFCLCCCNVVDGRSSGYGRADKGFTTKDMMAPTLKLKNPMEEM